MKPSFIPAYYRLAEDLKNQIEAGELKPGDMIPSEAQLAKQYGVSRMTVRQGVALLTQGGFIETVQGKGSFITKPRMDKLLFKFAGGSYLGDSEKISSRLHNVEVVKAGAEIAGKLKLATGTKIIRIQLLLATEDGIAALDTRFLPYVKGQPLLEMEIEYADFPELVARHLELVPVKNHFAISLGCLTANEAAILGEKHGTPALCIEQIVYAANDNPIGWSKIVCPNDRLKITAVSQTF